MVVLYVVLPFVLMALSWWGAAGYFRGAIPNAIARHLVGFVIGFFLFTFLVGIFSVETLFTDILGIALFAAASIGCWKARAAGRLAATDIGASSAHHPHAIEDESVVVTLKQMGELILADDVVDQREAEQLYRYLQSRAMATLGPVPLQLFQALEHHLQDGVLDATEAEDIKALLSEICDLPDKPVAKPEPAKATKPRAKPKKAVTPNKPAKPTGGAAWDTKKSSSGVSSDSDGPYMLHSGDEVRFYYIDSAGNETERLVVFRSASTKNGIAYLKGVCTSRRALRTFRADRISLMCMEDTGEYVGDPERLLARSA
ncbi:WYL domain-containing protein [Gallaecimonas sp. GXIMD4217]|uniref:WYL domain-containing protein n=1 Tax=Gallaecimonas sp. GXIMD4217 TaxID=3131927 RepID=UPI00311B1D83